MKIDFNIIHLSNVATIQPIFEYVLVTEEVGKNFTARVAIKYLPKSKVINIFRGNTDYIYQIFMTNLENLYKVYKYLIDEESKRTFCGYWLGSISNRLSDLIYSNDKHYLTAGFIPEKGAILIDGGVLDGVTSAMFSQMGYKVYAFELDKSHFESSKKVAEENKFVLENMGLGSYKHEVNYISNGGNSHIDLRGSEKAQITAIDDYVRENNIPRVDFIKLDVEGAELDTLKGARTTLARYKPILAISAYHKWDDIWTLIEFIKSVRPDYEFAMRQYCDEVPDSFNYLDDLGLELIIYNWWELCILAR